MDPADDGDQPSLLFLLTHEVKSGDGQVISKRLQFIRVLPDGSATFAGWAPHLDLEPLAATARPLLAETLAAPWLTAGLENRALALAAQTLVPEHFSEIAGRRIAHVDKTLAAVHERLTKEINYWSDRFIKLTDDCLYRAKRAGRNGIGRTKPCARAAVNADAGNTGLRESTGRGGMAIFGLHFGLSCSWPPRRWTGLDVG